MVVSVGGWMRGCPVLAAACLIGSSAALLVMLLTVPPTTSSHGASRNLQARPMIDIVGDNGDDGFPLGLCEVSCCTSTIVDNSSLSQR